MRERERERWSESTLMLSFNCKTLEKFLRLVMANTFSADTKHFESFTNVSQIPSLIYRFLTPLFMVSFLN